MLMNKGSLLLTIGPTGAYAEFTPYRLYPTAPPIEGHPEYVHGRPLLELLDAPPAIRYSITSATPKTSQFYMLSFNWPSFNAAVYAQRVIAYPCVQNSCWKYQYSVMKNTVGDQFFSDEKQEEYLSLWVMLYNLLDAGRETFVHYAGRRIIEHLILHASAGSLFGQPDNWKIDHINMVSSGYLQIYFEPVNQKPVRIDFQYVPTIQGRSQTARIKCFTVVINGDAILQLILTQ